MYLSRAFNNAVWRLDIWALRGLYSGFWDNGVGAIGSRGFFCMGAVADQRLLNLP